MVCRGVLISESWNRGVQLYAETSFQVGWNRISNTSMIFSQEMKIGLSENSVFNVFHPDASDLFNVCSNLDKVSTKLN